MSNKSFLIILVVIVLGVGGFIIANKRATPAEVLLGVKHPNQGQEHITRGQKHASYNSDPASSGPHYNDQGAPAPWGAYSQEIPPEVFVHNEEHGGIVITYDPTKLSAADVTSLQQLFTVPYSDPMFSPTKVLVMPRASNTHAIQMAAWTYTLNLDTYDKNILKKFYLQHVGQSPEAGAGPANSPQIIPAVHK